MLSCVLHTCSNDELELYAHIQAGAYDTTSVEWNRVSESGRKFLKDLLQLKPTKRLCCEEALRHEWLRKLLKLDSATGEYLLVRYKHFLLRVKYTLVHVGLLLLVSFRWKTHYHTAPLLARHDRCAVRGGA